MSSGLHDCFPFSALPESVAAPLHYRTQLHGTRFDDTPTGKCSALMKSNPAARATTPPSDSIIPARCSVCSRAEQEKWQEHSDVAFKMGVFLC